MPPFANMHDSIFRAQSVVGTVIDNDANINQADVILRFGVDEIDAFNEVVGRVDTASFLLSQHRPSKGDTLEVLTSEHSGKYKLARKVKVSGYIEVREIVRIAD